ncbi:FAD dependent oxidoreductase [Acephala macrosclerotiorum]|nr:FAD dependent oxidoreductase [Acephala macrosclerotiorum]
MTQTKPPVGLPRANPTKAYWQTPPLPISDHRSTPNLPNASKYVIVGSGITGTSIAWKIFQEEPNAFITILEARQACSGATGRNGGHCRAGRYLEFKDYLEKFGLEDALKIETLEEENVKNVGEFIKEHGIECDLRAVETVDIFTYQSEWEEALAALKARKEAFDGKVEAEVLTKHRVWSAKETREELLIPQGLGAISFPAYALSPYKFVCGLLEMCLKKGLNLQTNTPVVEVSQAHSLKKWIVHTDRGEIIADKVILATNAYTAALYPPLADVIIPTRGQVAALRPGSNIVNNPALKRTMGLNSAESGDYMQSRAEKFSGAGDLIVGGGRRLGTHGEQPLLDDTTIHPVVSEYLTHMAAKYFGRENWGEDGKVLQEWTGIMGYTFDKQPIIGEAPGQEGLWICAGFHGHGMAMTFQSAEALVQLLMGREKEVYKWLPANYRLSRVPKKTN